MLIAVAVSIPLGILSALRKNTWVDQVISVITLILASTPNFMVSIVFVIILSKFFPSYRFIGSYSSLAEFFQRIAVPAVALSFSPIALMARVTRSSMIEQMNRPTSPPRKPRDCRRAGSFFGMPFITACCRF